MNAILTRTPERDAAIRQQPVGTWGEFVASVEAHGVTDGTPLGGIEFGISQDRCTRRVDVDEDDGLVIIREQAR